GLSCGKFFFSSRRRHTRSVSAFLLNRSSDLGIQGDVLATDNNTSITHAYSIVIGSKHITLNATGGGFLTASKQFRHGATSKSRRSEERRVGKEGKTRWSRLPDA